MRLVGTGHVVAVTSPRSVARWVAGLLAFVLIGAAELWAGRSYRNAARQRLARAPTGRSTSLKHPRRTARQRYRPIGLARVTFTSS
jgi:hypothetical protein